MLQETSQRLVGCDKRFFAECETEKVTPFGEPGLKVYGEAMGSYDVSETKKCVEKAV
jgi:hypothetical protein